MSKNMVPCATCKGQNTIRKQEEHEGMTITTYTHCPSCLGEGHTCKRCGNHSPQAWCFRCDVGKKPEYVKLDPKKLEHFRKQVEG